ncbi:helix-turn-helix domain-containing protein [Nocardia sp. NPDC051030]|uniref:PucR family transcriptional regulator n=1 Tax=Nocardia sp. NPDC051030 TaxID=3155162 RepID=UPI0034347272
MRVDDLLRLETLGLQLVWGESDLLRQEIGGVTATDLLDPTEYLQNGEVVLSGLVWWTPRNGRQKADRFVAALRNAGAVALLAGVVRHRGLPDEVLRACREQGIVLAAVPAETTFRTITDEIYLRRWGALTASPHSSLPDHVRTGLDQLIRDRAEPTEVLDRIAVHLGGLPCTLVTASGRTIARSSAAPRQAPAAIVRSLRRGEKANHSIGPADSPYDTWYLRLPGPPAPPRLVQEVAEILCHFRDLAMQEQDRQAESATELATHLDRDDIENPSVTEFVKSIGPGPYRMVTAITAPHRPGLAVAALRELLAHCTDQPPAVGPHGERAVAVIPDIGDPIDRLLSLHELVRSCDPTLALHVGVGSASETPIGLRDSLIRSDHACRAAAHLGRGVTTAEQLTTLGELLAGVPTPVRTTFSTQVLGELLDPDPARTELRATLIAFLKHNGSWTRTAEALYLHVNTVHYRIERIEKLTGRNLSRLDDRIDLRAALHTLDDPESVPRAG